MWEKAKKKEKPNAWFSLLHCKSEQSEVHDPAKRKQLSSILTKKSARSGCSRSIANLKDVIHGSKRQLETPPTCSPRSIGSSEFLNPITHEVILSNSKCELKITGYGGRGAFAGTPGPPDHPSKNPQNPNRKNLGFLSHKKGPSGNGGSATCHKCGEQFVKWEALESHHLSKHAVTELIEGDSSRKIVEIICRSSWTKSDSRCVRIERVLKLHNISSIRGLQRDGRNQSQQALEKTSSLLGRRQRAFAIPRHASRLLPRHQRILESLRVG